MSNEVLIKQGNKAEWGEQQEQAQVDWNQNDESAPDYVKNRPRYSLEVWTFILEDGTTVTKRMGIFE